MELSKISHGSINTQKNMSVNVEIKFMGHVEILQRMKWNLNIKPCNCDYCVVNDTKSDVAPIHNENIKSRTCCQQKQSFQYRKWRQRSFSIQCPVDFNYSYTGHCCSTWNQFSTLTITSRRKKRRRKMIITKSIWLQFRITNE